MTYEYIRQLQENTPEWKLLRAKNAPLILGFMFDAFRNEEQVLTIPKEKFINRLVDYLELVQENTSTKSYEEQAQDYAEKWATDGYFYKYFDENQRPKSDVFELSLHAERTLQWLESLEKRDFVGTESRLEDIFSRLETLVNTGITDKDEKIEELEQQQERLKRQIEEITIHGLPPVQDYQIKERFIEIVRSAKDLTSDFKEVETNFSDIRKEIYATQAQAEISKGDILTETLDALERLKKSEQGKSFYAFWDFLFSEKRQKELESLTDKTYDLLVQRRISYTDDYLQNFKEHLFRAGRKVVQSNFLLAQKLNRVILASDLSERKKILETISKVREEALRLVEEPPEKEDFMKLDSFIKIQLPLEKNLHNRPQISADIPPPETLPKNYGANTEFSNLFDPYAINKEILEKNITKLLKKQSQVTLKEVIEKNPISKGLSELLTYLLIASENKQHFIYENETEAYIFDETQQRSVQFPKVIYTKLNQ